MTEAFVLQLVARRWPAQAVLRARRQGLRGQLGDVARVPWRCLEYLFHWFTGETCSERHLLPEPSAHVRPGEGREKPRQRAGRKEQYKRAHKAERESLHKAIDAMSKMADVIQKKV